MNDGSTNTISRRNFLKVCGGSALAWLITGLLVDATPTAAASPDAWGLLIDLTRCTGCHSCARACQDRNGLPQTETPPQKLSQAAYTFVEQRESLGTDGRQIVSFIKHQCMHCLHPACVSACTVGALHKTAEGPVVYEADQCIGCRYCEYACPFGVPTYDWANPLGLIHKCQMCAASLAEGQIPACVAACPSGALRFGKRAALLAQAQAQIASNPGRYVDQVYGEHEAGGTSVLYLSALPFAELGFPDLGPEPISDRAERVMKLTPLTALTVAVLAGGLHRLTKARDRLVLEPAAVKADQDDQPETDDLH